MYRIITADDVRHVTLMSHFIDHHESGHFLQSPQWGQVKKNWLWRGVIAYDRAGRIAGAMSVLIRRLPLGLSVLYAPRGPVCDRGDESVIRELFRGAESIAHQFHAPVFLTDPDVPDDNARFRTVMISNGFEEKSSGAFDNIQAQYVFRLDTAGRTEADILAAFPSKTRYNIRLAQRRGVEIRQYSGGGRIPDEAVSAFSRLMEVTGRRDRFLTRSESYFRQVLTSLGSNAVLFLACLDGEPIAGTIGVYYDRKAWYLYGASSNEHRGAMPNYLLQWEMIRRAVRLRCFFYDFRGVPGDLSKDNPLYGLYRFKRGFAGDYIKFTGLFIKKYQKAAGSLFMALWSLYRRLRRQRLKIRPLLLMERAASAQWQNISSAG